MCPFAHVPMFAHFFGPREHFPQFAFFLGLHIFVLSLRLRIKPHSTLKRVWFASKWIPDAPPPALAPSPLQRGTRRQSRCPHNVLRSVRFGPFATQKSFKNAPPDAMDNQSHSCYLYFVYICVLYFCSVFFMQRQKTTTSQQGSKSSSDGLARLLLSDYTADHSVPAVGSPVTSSYSSETAGPRRARKSGLPAQAPHCPRYFPFVFIILRLWTHIHSPPPYHPSTIRLSRCPLRMKPFHVVDPSVPTKNKGVQTIVKFWGLVC